MDLDDPRVPLLDVRRLDRVWADRGHVPSVGRLAPTSRLPMAARLGRP
jgi:hypothetical protein